MRCRHLIGAVFCVMALTLLPGCSAIMVLGYLIGGPPMVEPAFDSETKESMTDRGVTVAIVCYAPDEVKYSFEKIDEELAQTVSWRLHQHKIKVINPDRVKAWLDQNRDWDRPEEIGEAFKTKYVVYIDLNRFSLYEEGSTTLYRGRAEAIVSVWKMDDDGHGTKIFSRERVSHYPLTRPKATSEVSYGNFKEEYLHRLSDEIGHFFYEYAIADELVDNG